MYETTFQLSRRPFVAIPSSDQYFAAHSIENARSAIVRLVDRYEGPAMVIGPVGTGKSLLSQLVADYFRPRCRVALIPSGRICTRRTLLQVLLHELGLAYQGMEEGELRLSLIDHLTSIDFCPNGTLLMVDEADALPMALLDELRTMTNLVANGQPCIRLVLFGSPRLEEKFTHPRLESFNQRLAGRFYLEPLNRNETLEYIVTQFDECGGDSSLTFSNEALEAIYRATNGVPRMVNQLTDHALILATADGKTFIDQEMVNAAWSDLQQLPAPAPISFGPSIGAEHIIEFGELDAVESSEPHDFDSARSAEPSTNQNPMEMIDEMQRQLTELESDGNTSMEPHEPANLPQEPTDGIEEPSIHLHEAFDPFGDSFEEEEEVIVSQIAATDQQIDDPAATTSPAAPAQDTDSIASDFNVSEPVNEQLAENIPIESQSTNGVSGDSGDRGIHQEVSQHDGPPDNEPILNDSWEEEFDPSTDPVIPEGFHEFIVESEATAETQDCSQDQNELPQYSAEQTSLPEVVDVNAVDSAAPVETDDSGQNVAHDSREIAPMTPDASVPSEELPVAESHDGDNLDKATETQANDEPNVGGKQPADYIVDGTAQFPEFVIPELTEADGVIMSMPDDSFVSYVDESSKVADDAASEPSAETIQEPAPTPAEDSQFEVAQPDVDSFLGQPPTVDPVVVTEKAHAPSSAETISEASSEPLGQTPEVTEPIEVEESIPEPPVRDELHGPPSNCEEIVYQEQPVADEETLPLSGESLHEESMPPAFADELAAIAPTAEPDGTSPQEPQPIARSTEPAVGGASPKRFNRLFSKMQTK